MAYADPFHRIVVIGKIYGDIFNTTLTVGPKGAGLLPLDAVSQAECQAIATVIGDWFRDTSPVGSPLNALNISSITSVKVNRIGTDGKYMDDVTREYVFPSPQVGNSVGTAPAQIAVVASLLTASERGLAHRGRMYLPPLLGYAAPGADGRVPLATAGTTSAAVARLVNQINDLYDAKPVTDVKRGRVSVASNKGSGLFREVTRVEVGRVPDTMRSRRNTLVEDHQGTNVLAS